MLKLDYFRGMIHTDRVGTVRGAGSKNRHAQLLRLERPAYFPVGLSRTGAQQPFDQHFGGARRRILFAGVMMFDQVHIPLRIERGKFPKDRRQPRKKGHRHAEIGRDNYANLRADQRGQLGDGPAGGSDNHWDFVLHGPFQMRFEYLRTGAVNNHIDIGLRLPLSSNLPDDLGARFPRYGRAEPPATK